MRLRFSAALLALLLIGSASAQTPARSQRLFYIGLALYSESWSQNDVVELAGKLRTVTQAEVVPMIASNVTGFAKLYPIADDATIRSLVRRVAEQARPDDIVFVDISTHGAPRVLARKIGNHAVTALPAHELAQLLAPLSGRPTVLVISACYSGSFVDDLMAPNRIIMTAARADRSSFGCAPGNRHTLFGEAELRAFQQNRSLRQVFAAIRDDVARMERERHYTPSEPQVSVGADVTELYDAAMF